MTILPRTNQHLSFHKCRYHWGFAAWSPYIIVAAAAGIASYRFDMPMTVRSTLYTLLGAHTWGWIGDLLDGFCKCH